MQSGVVVLIPGFLTAQTNTLLPGCQIKVIFVTSSFIFVVKEEEDQVLAKKSNDFKLNL